MTSRSSSFTIWAFGRQQEWVKRTQLARGVDVTIYDTHTSKARSRVDLSGAFALVMILAVLATIALDAYAFSTLKF